MEKLTDAFSSLRPGEGARRRRRDPALRLLGRRALARGLRGVRAAVLGADPGARSTARRSTSAPAPRRSSRQMADAGGDVIGLDWRIPLDWGWERRRRRPRRAGQPRRRPPARPVGARRARDPRRARARRPAGPATSSTSATASCRTPTRTCSAGCASSCTSRPPAFRHEPRRGRPDGVRLAGPARGRARLLRRHPRRPADPAGAARRPRRALPAARDRGVEPAERDHRGDARGARGRARPARLHRHAALAAADRRGGRARARRRRRDDRRARARAALLLDVDREVPRRCSRRRSATAPSCASSSAGATSPASSSCSPSASRRSATTTRTSSSPRTRCRRGSSTRATRTWTSCSRRPRLSPSARRSTTGRSRSRASRRPASRGSGPTSSTTSTSSPAQGVRDVVALPRRLRRRPSRDPLGPRHRGRRAGAGARARAARGSRCRTPTRPSCACSRAWSGSAARCTVDGVRTGEIRVEAVSRRFRVHAREARTLKELFVLARPHRADGRLGAARRLAPRRAGRGGRPDRPQRLRQVDAAAPDRGDHQADVGAASPSAAAIGSLLELGAGFHPDFSGRENVFLNGAIYGLRKARDPRALRRDRRVRRARGRDRPAGAHVLVGDVHAARLRDRRAPRRRRAPARRGLRGRGRGLPAQVLRQDLRVQAARRHDRLRLARRDAGRAPLRARRAPARRRRRARRARRTTRSSATGACSPPSPIPPSAPPACASGGPARRRSRRPSCSAPDGEERQQFLAGEPLSLRLRIDARERASPPPRLQLELRDDGGPARRLRRGRHGDARLGTARASGCSASTSSGCRSPTGASTSGSASATPSGERAPPLARRRARLPRLSRPATSAASCAWKGAGRSSEEIGSAD